MQGERDESTTEKPLNAKNLKSYAFAQITDLTRISEFDAWDTENAHARQGTNGKVLFEEIRAIQKARECSQDADEKECKYAK